MALKGKKPEDVTQSKPKFMISGESGVGKTFFALNFPKPYLIDTEGGATRKQYREKLVAAGGAYFGKEEGSQDFKSVLDEVKSLATTQHGYKTLIIDSFSYLYMLEAAEAELAGGSEFGRDKKEANKPTRQLIKLLEKLDMNVIIICHHKTKWTKQGKNVIVHPLQIVIQESHQCFVLAGLEGNVNKNLDAEQQLATLAVNAAKGVIGSGVIAFGLAGIKRMQSS
jgi:hypothetical protein